MGKKTIGMKVAVELFQNNFFKDFRVQVMLFE